MIAELGLPLGQYRILLWLMGAQKDDGMVYATQQAMSEKLGMDRTTIQKTLVFLDKIHLVEKVKNGVYRLNAMLRGYESDDDMWAAIDGMPEDERLDTADYIPWVRRLQRPLKAVAG
ncbi:replication/maintenance protein RepL [Embleya sp. NBC_00896]|uniref:replication/maintenance protein RepL n=1 Tax=Embleya sp. NBC_00896 TaxID=2975961 RepID=UPI002F91BE97|nr:replication/maintenance protein RepL [Embleya sp. NBC_00896]